MVRFLVPREDRWPAQVQEAFAFLFDRGFVVLDRSTYRLGESSVIAKSNAGVALDADFDAQLVSARLIRLQDGSRPDRWWENRTPRCSMDLGEVARVLAPESRQVQGELPRLRAEADRAPHLRFWASVLRAVASPWLEGDERWFDRTAQLLPTTPGVVVAAFLRDLFACTEALRARFSRAQRLGPTEPLLLFPVEGGPGVRFGHLDGLGEFNLHGRGCLLELRSGAVVDFDWDDQSREVFDGWRLQQYARSTGAHHLSGPVLVEAARADARLQETRESWFAVVAR